MEVAIVAVVAALVAFVVGVESSKSVVKLAGGIVAAALADAHAVVSGGGADIQALGARVSALEHRAALSAENGLSHVAQEVKAEVAKV